MDKKLAESNFSCRQCLNDYKRDELGYNCIDRENKSNTCFQYDYSDDKCITCIPNHYLSDDEKECLEYPNGEIGCLMYEQIDEEKRCIQCDTSKYILDNYLCKEFVNPVANCAIMLKNYECSICKPGYFLNETVPETEEFEGYENWCEETTLDNCEIASSTTECSDC